MCFIAADKVRQARIASTTQSSFYHSNYTATNLLNNKGLSGMFKGDNCARTNYGPTPTWFSFELEIPLKLFSVQITPRLDCCPERSQNISVTISPSVEYDPDEHLCSTFDLVLERGLTEYKCTGKLHQGRFVKISRHVNGSDGIIDICEVKIFTVGGNHNLKQSYYLCTLLWNGTQV